MRRNFQLLVICLFVFSIFFSISQTIQASEVAPPAPQGDPVQNSQVSAPGGVNAYVMDPNARAVLPTDSFDFGSVYEGNDIYHDFIIKNEGSADLKIINVKSG
jgi:hypothetical protein